jgi:hypothetical protein
MICSSKVDCTHHCSEYMNPLAGVTELIPKLLLNGAIF